MMNKHVQQVRQVYKTILRLHRGLPLDFRAMGDQYAKDEFRRHKDATPEQARVFMTEWTTYAIKLATQLRRSPKGPLKIGENLAPEQFDKFSTEQMTQLMELLEETQKPVDPDDPLGHNPQKKDDT